MYRIEQLDDEGLATYRLYDERSDSFFEVVPERGGIITRLVVNGVELLYLNKESLYHREANIRGGIPILFPISGQLQEGKYEWEGKTYSMNNHGVARNRPWQVVNTQTTAGAAITLALKSDESTKREFPFDFEVQFTYTLKNGVLTVDQEYRNDSHEAMPIYAGFHPYFKTNVKCFPVDADATKVFDYNDLNEYPFNGTIDLQGKKESLAFLDAKRPSISFPVQEDQHITMAYGPEFTYIVFWQEADKEFICVEPWMSLTGELNRKQELVFIEPKQVLKTYLSIGVRHQD